jgi:mannose-6-phosphate isomerase-like protein (cupin superfamily)
MEVTHGTWGIRTVTFKGDNHICTILVLMPHKRCSWHYHKTAYNQFYVVAGELGVKTDIGPKGQRQTIKMQAGQTFTVPPGVTHEFQTYDKKTIVEEIAYVKYDPSDIHRNQLGGDMPKDE